MGPAGADAARLAVTMKRNAASPISFSCHKNSQLRRPDSSPAILSKKLDFKFPSNQPFENLTSI